MDKRSLSVEKQQPPKKRLTKAPPCLLINEVVLLSGFIFQKNNGSENGGNWGECTIFFQNHSSL